MTTTYGILSDFHGIDPKILGLAVSVFKHEEADGLILNGDLVGERFRPLDEKEYLALLLQIAGNSGLETYVQPGSHEEVEHFELVVEFFSEKFGNVHNAMREPKIEGENYHLVFLAGSDWRPPNSLRTGYALEKQAEAKSGFYRNEKNEVSRLTNMQDLRKLVTSPEKTIVISHIPRRFDNVETAVDMAEFGEASLAFLLQGKKVEAGSVFPDPFAAQLKGRGYPVELKRENRGNEDLYRLYEELGIVKSVTGHFHESAHRAVDRRGRPVPEAEFVDELFWNASYADGFKAGLLSIADGKAAYENINLRKYLRQE